MDQEKEKTQAENIPVEDANEAPQTEGAPDENQKKIDELTAQYNQMREVAARAQADGINYRNWAEREFKRLKAFGSERAVLAMLPVLDNLELALGNAEADPASIKEGVRMVRSQFGEALKNLGVTEIDPTGKPFSPLEHDAMGMVNVSDFVDSYAYDVISDIVEKLPKGSTVKRVKSKCPEGIRRSTIRMVMADVKRKQQEKNKS